MICADRGNTRELIPSRVKPEDGAVAVSHPDQLGNGVCERVELPLTRLQGRLGALAFGNLLGCDIHTQDFAAQSPQWVPVGDPLALFGLTCALPGDLDADHGLARSHDRAHDLFDRIRQRRHAFANRAAQMVLHGDAADFRETLIDLEITAIRRKKREADRCGVID
jgi:hypothetical protein